MAPAASQSTGGKTPGGSSTPKPPGKPHNPPPLPADATSSPAAALAALRALFERAGPKAAPNDRYILRKTGYDQGIELINYLVRTMPSTTTPASGAPLSIDQVRSCMKESLSAFGEGLVTRLASTPRDPVGATGAATSYAAAARRSLTTDRSTEREISFSTASAGATDPIRQGSPKTIKGILDAAIEKSGIPDMTLI